MFWSKLNAIDCSNYHPATLADSHFLPSIYSYLRSIENPAHLKIHPLNSFLHGLKLWYFSTDPLHSGITICLWISLICWLLGELTGDISQVDRLWTFLPVLYSVHFVVLAPKLDPRMLLLLICQIAWSIRLTINTIRRGFFELKEDYRWQVLRTQISRWQLKLLNLTFIAFIQNILLFLTSLPQYLLLTTQSYPASEGNSSLTGVDYALTSILVIVLMLEMMADNQQQAYQSAKRASQSRLSTTFIKRGFLTSDFWSYSRHPNVACEQLVWYVLYGFTLSATWSNEFCWARLVNYSITSPLFMSALLYSSTLFTESISASKYPIYANYQKTTDMFWPPLSFIRRGILKLTLTDENYSRLVENVFGDDLDQKQE